MSDKMEFVTKHVPVRGNNVFEVLYVQIFLIIIHRNIVS